MVGAGLGVGGIQRPKVGMGVTDGVARVQAESKAVKSIMTLGIVFMRIQLNSNTSAFKFNGQELDASFEILICL